MSKLYKRSDSSYYWWTAVLNGLRLRKSTMMTKKSLALKIKDVGRHKFFQSNSCYLTT